MPTPYLLVSKVSVVKSELITFPSFSQINLIFPSSFALRYLLKKFLWRPEKVLLANDKSVNFSPRGIPFLYLFKSATNVSISDEVFPS